MLFSGPIRHQITRILLSVTVFLLSLASYAADMGLGVSHRILQAQDYTDSSSYLDIQFTLQNSGHHHLRNIELHIVDSNFSNDNVLKFGFIASGGIHELAWSGKLSLPSAYISNQSPLFFRVNAINSNGDHVSFPVVSYYKGARHAH
ncbi:MAG: hypothetical protein OEZ58_06025 [Gammaproteobacteria bacterium]|nr:hypothetical protein [Gammaproteobacteria bacterium]